MKWKTSNKQQELSEKFRTDYEETITKYLWLPLRINGEWRWLEECTVERMPWIRETIFGNRYFWIHIKYIDI